MGTASYLGWRLDGPIGDRFPSFAHTAATGFALIAIVGRRPVAAAVASALFGALLESAQASRLVLLGPGTFDRGDVAAVLLAATAVAVVGHRWSRPIDAPAEPSRPRRPSRSLLVVPLAIAAVLTSAATGHEPDPDAGIRTVPVAITFEPEVVVLEAGATSPVTIIATVDNPSDLTIEVRDAPSQVTPAPERCSSPGRVREFRCEIDVTADDFTGVWLLDVVALGEFTESIDVNGSADLRVEIVPPTTTTLPLLDDDTGVETASPEPEVACPPGPAPVGAGSGDAATAFDVSEIRIDGNGSWGSAGGVTSLELLGQGGVTVGHVHPDVVWTPCQDGTVETIAIEVSGVAASANDTGAVAVRALVRQGDNLFVAPDAFSLRAADGTIGTSWALSADSVTQLDGTDPLDLASGPTVRVGYTVALTCPTGSICSTIERSFTLDSFSVDVVTR